MKVNTQKNVILPKEKSSHIRIEKISPQTTGQLQLQRSTFSWPEINRSSSNLDLFALFGYSGLYATLMTFWFFFFFFDKYDVLIYSFGNIYCLQELSREAFILHWWHCSLCFHVVKTIFFLIIVISVALSV